MDRIVLETKRLRNYYGMDYGEIAERVGLNSQEVRQILNLENSVAFLLRGLHGGARIKEMARIRDDHTCQKCGKVWEKGQRRLDVHHLKGCGFYTMVGYHDRLSDLDNLTTLCHKCHMGFPHIRARMRKGTSEGVKRWWQKRKNGGI